MIDNVIVAFSPLGVAIPNGKGTIKFFIFPIQNSRMNILHSMNISEEASDSSDADSSKCDRILPGLLKLWRVLESHVKKGIRNSIYIIFMYVRVSKFLYLRKSLLSYLYDLFTSNQGLNCNNYRTYTTSRRIRH